MENVEYYTSLARNCRDLAQAKLLYSSVLSAGGHVQRDRYLSNLLIEMFGRCGSIEDAQLVFGRIEEPNVFSWNMMLGAYAQTGDVQKTRSFFDQMQQRDVVSWNSMLSSYARDGSVEQCQELFASAPRLNALSWASLISVFVRNQHFPEAVGCFILMDLEGFRPSGGCYVSVLEACTALGDLRLGETIHDEATASGFTAGNVAVATSLIKMYGNFGEMERVEAVFQDIQDVNVVVTTSMIVAYAQNKRVDKAREMFARIKNPDVVAWTCLISAYADAENITEARRVFDEMPVRNVVSWNSMLSAYAQKGYVIQARELFDRMSERDEVTWSSILTLYAGYGPLEKAMKIFSDMPKSYLLAWNTFIAACVRGGNPELALKLFKLMALEGITPSKLTFVSVLDACASTLDLGHGKVIHEMILSHGLESNAAVGTGLVEVYNKCGNLEGARKAFEAVIDPDVICWTALILAYARNGHCRESLKLFSVMCSEGVKPNEVTLAGVLFACCHSGEVEESVSCFHSIEQDFGLLPTVDQYISFVDMLGRAGRLDEAQDLVDAMPRFETEVVTWETLLAACKLHSDAARACNIVKNVSHSETMTGSSYVLLANIYADKS